MEQYIPKSVVLAEIENRIDRCNTKKWSCPANTQVEALCDNKICAYKEILSFLYTTEVKNVDLEKEMNDYFVSMEVQENENIFESTFRLIAKHFFNLGLKAQVNKI